MTEMPQRK